MLGEGLWTDRVFHAFLGEGSDRVERPGIVTGLFAAVLAFTLLGGAIAHAVTPPAGTPPSLGGSSSVVAVSGTQVVTTDDVAPSAADDRPLPVPVALGAFGVIAVSIAALAVVKRLTAGRGAQE